MPEGERAVTDEALHAMDADWDGETLRAVIPEECGGQSQVPGGAPGGVLRRAEERELALPLRRHQADADGHATAVWDGGGDAANDEAKGTVAPPQVQHEVPQRVPLHGRVLLK